MKLSQQVLEWQEEARKEALAEGALMGQRAALLRVLKARFKKKIPARLAAAIEAMNDLDKLSRWVDVASIAGSLEDFRSAIQV